MHLCAKYLKKTARIVFFFSFSSFAASTTPLENIDLCTEKVLNVLVTKYLQKSPLEKLQSLSQSDAESFKKFMNQTGARWNEELTDETEAKKIFEQYLLYSLNQFSNLSYLEAEQRTSLRRSLELQGVPDLSGDPWITFKQISEKNLARISKKIDAEKSLVNRLTMPIKTRKRVEKILDMIELKIVHNGNNNDRSEDHPILSSRRLVQSGLDGGAQSRAEFNATLLESDDNVFFLPYLSVKNQLSQYSSKYGKHGIVLNNEYAKDRLWLSPFIMEPYDFAKFIETQDPDLASELFEKLKNLARTIQTPEQSIITYGKNFNMFMAFFMGLDKNIPYLIDDPSWIKARHLQSAQDLTASDYFELARKLVRWSLVDHMWSHDRRMFEYSLSAMEDQETYQDLKTSRLTLIFENALEHFGLVRFEGKVPVAVPPRNFKAF